MHYSIRTPWANASAAESTQRRKERHWGSVLSKVEATDRPAADPRRDTALTAPLHRHSVRASLLCVLAPWRFCVFSIDRLVTNRPD